jgi:hypothetical protein
MGIVAEEEPASAEDVIDMSSYRARKQGAAG